MGQTERIRSRASRGLGAAMVAFSVVALVLAVVGGVDSVLRFAAPVSLFGLFGWAAFWQPYVEVSDGGLTLANTLRTVEVPWPAVEEIDGRYGLRVRTAYGVLNGWAAPSPAGRQRARGEPGTAARVATERWDSLRTAGYLDDPRLERPSPRIVWHQPLLLAIGLLLVATVVLPLIA